MGRSVRMLAKPIEISAWWARRGGRKRKRGELDEEEVPARNINGHQLGGSSRS